jgi:ubiquinone/menaquinone biosynthesis C-methylase UbiE
VDNSDSRQEVINRIIARQLGNPSGLGKVLAPLWNQRNSALNDTAFEALDLQPNNRVLEVGFGGGYLLQRMTSTVTNSFLAGVDISQAMVTNAQKRLQRLITQGKLELHCCPVEVLPFPPNYFTKACSVNSIFYWENATQALAEIRRVLDQDGLIVLCQTCPKSLEDRGFASHMARYEASDIFRMLEAGGFHDIHITNASDKHREYMCLSGRKLTSV